MAEITVKEKLASQGSLTTQFAVGKDLRTGKIIAEEYGKQLRGQMSLDEEMEVDKETGEVVDFRKVK